MQQYLTGRRSQQEDEDERGFSSPSSPNNSQALITHKVRVLLTLITQQLTGSHHPQGEGFPHPHHPTTHRLSSPTR